MTESHLARQKQQNASMLTYESHSLLWRRDEWRQPNSAERCATMCIPPAAVMSVNTPPAKREQQRNSLIGNGFHIPSIMILLTLLPHLLQAKFVHPGVLQARLQGTVWEPGRLDVWPHLLDAADVVRLLPTCFAHLALPDELLLQVHHRLAHCRLSRLQEFAVWQQMRGEPVASLGPTPIFGRDRTFIYSGLSGQRYPSSSSRGLDHLLPPGLGALVPLEDWLATMRSPSAAMVAASKRPAFCATLAILLRWPDLSLGSSLVEGFPIVGVLANSGVFRHVTPSTAPELQDWLGPAAEEAINRIVHSGPPRFHEDILAVTQDEQEKRFCSPFFTKKELDDRFGVGAWRPMERFLVVQSDGKKRVIDNARKSGHNTVTTLFETIHTVSVDFVASVAAMLSSTLDVPDIPSWLVLRIGTDDLPDAYRGLPVREEHLAYSVVAVYVGSLGWRFTVLHGLAYGLESAVVAFNRFPSLGIGIARRCALALGAAYFDDQLAMEVIADADAKVLSKLQDALEKKTLSRDEAGKLRGDLCWLFSMCSGHTGKIAGPLLTEKQHGTDPNLSESDIRTLHLLQAMVSISLPRDVHVRSDAPPPVVIYSDASFEDGVLRLGWVIFDGTAVPVGRSCVVPPAVLESWLERRQQISPGETICGLLVPIVHPEVLRSRDVLWFIDNECAVSSLIKASSPQSDIHLIAQFSQAAYHALQARVWFEWIDSASNPSDGLSRAGSDQQPSQILLVWCVAQPQHLGAKAATSVAVETGHSTQCATAAISWLSFARTVTPGGLATKTGTWSTGRSTWPVLMPRRQRSRSRRGLEQKASSSRRRRTSRSPSRTWPASPARQSRSSAASSGHKVAAVPLAPEAAMEPLLMELLSERNDAFLAFLTELGVQTCRDLHNLWPTGSAMVEEFESKHGKHSADEAFGMAMVFTLAGHRAHDALLQSIDMVVEERSSSQLQKPSLRLEVAPLTSITPTVRRVLDTGFRGPAPVLQACAAADPAVKEHATKQIKLNALFQLLLEDIDVTELGLSWTALQDPMKLQKFKDTLMEAPSRLSFQRIGALTSSMRRWKRWAVQRGYSVQAPTPLQLSEFLREVASGGPTAASSMWHACHWFSEKMGCRLPTDHFLTRPFKMHAVTHTGSQALELSPGELVNLVLLASRSRGTKSVLLAFMIQSAVSCVRFEHIQRSTLVKCHKDFIEFRCSQGKSRRQGARPAYNWSTPEVHFQGWSLCATLKDFFSHEALPEVGYLWPSLRLSAEDLWEVSDSTPFDLSRPMARSRFLELLRGTLLETGVEAGESVTAGYNRLRRFMPTLGNCLRLDKDSMQAIGSWVEIPAGGGPLPTRKERAGHDMSLHYAGQKVHRSAQVKGCILKRFFKVFRRKQAELAMSDKGLLVRDAWTWPEFMAVNEHFVGDPFEIDPEEVVADEDLGCIEVEDGALDGIEEPELPLEDCAPPSPVASNSDDDSSSSASDVSADPMDLVGVLPEQDTDISLQWFQQGAKVHVVRLIPDEGPKIPWCRDRPFPQDPAKVCDLQHFLAQATMTQASRIDVFQSDRGLQSCLAAANVNRTWADSFVKQHSVDTLEDFCYLVRSSEWERAMEDLVQATPGLKDNRIAAARFKAAYETGMQAIKQASQMAKAGPEALDEPLPEATNSQLSKDFKTKYGIELDPFLDPCDALRARVYREFRKGTISVVDVRKVRSIVSSSIPKSQDSLALPGGLKLEFDRDIPLDITNAIQYYFGLRTLMYAWSWAGSYVTRDYDGKDRCMAPLLQDDKPNKRAPKREAETPPAPPPKRERMVKSDAHQTISMLRGGKKICKPFNDGRGCKGGCQNAHVCDEKLSAAKPLTWRGKGDLPQAVWAIPPKGTFLLIELWSGISGLAIAMLSVGFTVYGVAAETDSTARECAQAVLPHLVHYEAVEQVKAADFRGLLTRRKPRAVIMGGGSPCQGNSALNSARQGLSDPRSLQPWHLHRLRKEFKDLPEMEGITLILLLENVASMPKQVQEQYDEWLQCSPILIEAGFFGWVHRKRLYWMASEEGSLGVDTPLPSDWSWIPPQGKSPPELRYQGKKPFPSRVVWDHQFTPTFDPSKVMAQGGRGGFHTFTREFYHPDDRVPSCSPEAAERFYADSRRFPPGSYESHSLLWRRDEWRQPNSAERCATMCIPPAAVMSVNTPPAKREQQRNSLIGNGFHIPSIMILLTLLPHLLQAKFVHPTIDPGDGVLQARLQGTVWEPGRLDVWPHLLDAADVVRLLPTCFAHLALPDELLLQVHHRLAHCRLSRLQEFAVWQQMRGEPVASSGPTPIFGRDRTFIYSGLSGQRYPSSSSRGLDHLLPPGLGVEAHMTQSALLPSPFKAKPWPEADVCFMVEAVTKWQVYLIPRAAEQRRILRSVAHGDYALSQCCYGGCVKATSFLCYTGYPSPEAINRIVHSGPPRFHEDILAVTQDEQEKRFCSPFFTKKELDDRFGVGAWRPMERFLVVQSHGKKRVIDNARKSGHNTVTTLFETIHTVSVDFVASVAAMLSNTLDVPDIPSWLVLRIGTDDLPDAYRGLPVREEHLAYSVVAVYVGSLGWRFTVLHGLAYGLESAVVAFNRFPSLGIGIARRCALALGAAYFDDQLAMEVIADADVSQRGIQLVFQLMGAPPQPAKSFPPTANRHYLGTSVHTADFSHGGTLCDTRKGGVVLLLHLTHHCAHLCTEQVDLPGSTLRSGRAEPSGCSRSHRRFA
eukprot:symbB.v1.2.035390.t1/scaffold4753.1/size44016/3